MFRPPLTSSQSRRNRNGLRAVRTPMGGAAWRRQLWRESEGRKEEAELSRMERSVKKGSVSQSETPIGVNSLPFNLIVT